jgi:tellurite resistance protein TehA-like permease
VLAFGRDEVVLEGRGQDVWECDLRLFDPVSRKSAVFEDGDCGWLTSPLRLVSSLALVIWGFGLVWLVLATSSVLNLTRREKIGFNMGWWGFTFPIGVFAVCTVQFGNELDSMAFRVLGTILSCTVVALWSYVSVMTCIRAWSGVM